MEDSTDLLGGLLSLSDNTEKILSLTAPPAACRPELAHHGNAFPCLQPSALSLDLATSRHPARRRHRRRPPRHRRPPLPRRSRLSSLPPPIHLATALMALAFSPSMTLRSCSMAHGVPVQLTAVRAGSSVPPRASLPHPARCWPWSSALARPARLFHARARELDGLGAGLQGLGQWHQQHKLGDKAEAWPNRLARRMSQSLHPSSLACRHVCFAPQPP